MVRDFQAECKQFVIMLPGPIPISGSLTPWRTSKPPHHCMSIWSDLCGLPQQKEHTVEPLFSPFCNFSLYLPLLSDLSRHLFITCSASKYPYIFWGFSCLPEYDTKWREAWVPEFNMMNCFVWKNSRTETTKVVQAQEETGLELYGESA